MVAPDREVLRCGEERGPDVVGGAPNDTRAELCFEDAFEYLSSCNERFDVVLSDLPDAPIAGYTPDDQIRLMSRVLTESGTFGTHAELTKFDRPYDEEPIIAAISRWFEHLEVTRKVIPSYQDQIWLFVRAKELRSEVPLA